MGLILLAWNVTHVAPVVKIVWPKKILNPIIFEGLVMLVLILTVDCYYRIWLNF